MLKQMDAYGVERAAVSSLSAVHFLNPQDGNDELARGIASCRDRLVPFAVLRPNFAGWRDDLAVCVERYGMQGIVLYPNYHEFQLSDSEMASLMAEAERLRLPVCVQAGLEDLRRQFRPYKIEEVAPTAIGDLARAYPHVTVIALGLKFGQPELMGEPLPDNLYFDTSNYESMGELEEAVKRFGSHKILFGSNFPLFNLRANVDKVRKADLEESDRDAIATANAQRILSAYGQSNSR
jgi:predicted TIM-barrel fold metal-dependent hydrolase